MSSAQTNNSTATVDGHPGDAASGRTFPINDYALERIIYRAPHEAAAPIPWPDGLAVRLLDDHRLGHRHLGGHR